MTVRTYLSTDASAPTLTGQVGSLVALLDAVLVNGYGAKAAAGWAKAFTGTDKAAYRNNPGTGTGLYWRVQDDAPGAAGAQEARIRGYETMSDVDTGTGLFPTTAQETDGCFVRKSASADATARAWAIVADDITAWIHIITGDTNGWVNFGFGDIGSFKPADGYAGFLVARTTENSSSMSTSVERFASLNASSRSIANKWYCARTVDGTGSAISCASQWDDVWSISSSPGSGGMTYPHPADGKLHIVPMFITDPAGNIVRGRLRGVWSPCHSRPANDLDTFSATITGVSRTFIALHVTGTGQVAVENSDTWD